jgi:hypothetical protein
MNGFRTAGAGSRVGPLYLNGPRIHHQFLTQSLRQALRELIIAAREFNVGSR